MQTSQDVLNRWEVVVLYWLGDVDIDPTMVLSMAPAWSVKKEISYCAPAEHSVPRDCAHYCASRASQSRSTLECVKKRVCKARSHT
jgi:hypothetical protein